MVYTIKVPLRVGANPLYYDLEFTKGDKVNLWLKFYDESGGCLEAKGDILVAGYKDGLLFESNQSEAKEDGWYEVPLNLNTVPLFESSAKRIKVIVRFEDIEDDKLRTISFEVAIKNKVITGSEPAPELLPLYPAPEELLKRVLEAPDGSLWEVSVDNSGNLITTLIS